MSIGYVRNSNGFYNLTLALGLALAQNYASVFFIVCSFKNISVKYVSNVI